MKKYLKLSLLLLVVVLSCSKEIKESDSPAKINNQKQAITFGEAVNMLRSLASSSLQSRLQTLATVTTGINLAGQSYCVQNTNTSTPGIVFSTNGQSYHQATSIYLETKNVVNDIQGSGIAVNFPFKQGKNYTITLELSNVADEWDHEVASKSRWPSLQVQLTNTVLASINNCSVVTPPFILSGPDPIQTVLPTSETNVTTTKTLSFTPTQCYNYIRLSAIPNMTGKSKGVVIISKLFITEISGIQIDGPSSLSLNQQGTFTVGYNGFPIGSAFTWTVTGDLQIIGSAVGSSVNVKANSPYGGTIVIGLNGCELLATKTIAADFSQIQIVPQGNYNGQICGNKPTKKDIYSVALPAGATVKWVTEGCKISGSTTSANVSIYGDPLFEETEAKLIATITIPGNPPFEKSLTLQVVNCP
ncbi:hypothetical protein [Pedobacter panaciterrae]